MQLARCCIEFMYLLVHDKIDEINAPLLSQIYSRCWLIIVDKIFITNLAAWWAIPEAQMVVDRPWDKAPGLRKRFRISGSRDTPFLHQCLWFPLMVGVNGRHTQWPSSGDDGRWEIFMFHSSGWRFVTVDVTSIRRKDKRWILIRSESRVQCIMMALLEEVSGSLIPPWFLNRLYRELIR